MLSEWRQILSFPQYSVCDQGYVRNENNGRFLAVCENQRGILVVGLMRNRRQYKRAIAPIVGEAFLEPRPDTSYNSLINLDGDRHNNRADNLVWRPLWFARMYFQQFKEPIQDSYYPIEDADTHERFYNPWEAAVKYGLLRSDIVIAIRTKTRVWPTGQRFKMVQFTR